jgi:TetR/AcrR family transcriptional regulator, regulator of cefoperazone and chloramphenicol sensitivity
MSLEPSETVLRSHRVTPGQRKQKRRPTARGTETRAQVIDAAVQCICEEGFGAATMRRIAERAGVTWGVMQYHFGDRGGLLSAVLETGYANLTERLRRIGIEGGDLRSRIRGLVDSGWDIFCAPMTRACFEIVLATRSEMTPRSASRDRLFAVARQLAQGCDKLLGQALHDKHPPKKAERVFLSALRGLAFEAMQYPSEYGYERERDALTDVLTAYLVQHVAESSQRTKMSERRSDPSSFPPLPRGD